MGVSATVVARLLGSLFGVQGRRRLARGLWCAAALALFVVLSAAWLPTSFGSRPEAYTSFEMKAEQDEEPREAVGLLICAVWSGVLAWRARTLTG